MPWGKRAGPRDGARPRAGDLRPPALGPLLRALDIVTGPGPARPTFARPGLGLYPETWIPAGGGVAGGPRGRPLARPARRGPPTQSPKINKTRVVVNQVWRNKTSVLLTSAGSPPGLGDLRPPRSGGSALCPGCCSAARWALSWRAVGLFWPWWWLYLQAVPWGSVGLLWPWWWLEARAPGPGLALRWLRLACSAGLAVLRARPWPWR